jgi:hypothetical protein
VALQSASLPQPPEAAGTQTPLCGPHAPLWQRSSAFWALQGPTPAINPHLPLLPQALFVHSPGAAQLAPTASLQVSVVGLQVPVAQAKAGCVVH